MIMTTACSIEELTQQDIELVAGGESGYAGAGSRSGYISSTGRHGYLVSTGRTETAGDDEPAEG